MDGWIGCPQTRFLGLVVSVVVGSLSNMSSTVDPPLGDPVPPVPPVPPVHAAVDVLHDALDPLTTADLDVLPAEDLRLLTGRLLQVGHRVARPPCG